MGGDSINFRNGFRKALRNGFRNSFPNSKSLLPKKGHFRQEWCTYVDKTTGAKVEKEEGEQNEWKTLHSQLEGTQLLIKTLSSQLSELRDQMTEQRKQKQRAKRRSLVVVL